MSNQNTAPSLNPASKKFGFNMQPTPVNPNIQRLQYSYICQPLAAHIPPTSKSPKNNNLAGQEMLPYCFIFAYPIPTQQAPIPNGFAPSFAGCQPYMMPVNGMLPYPSYLPSPPTTPEQAMNTAGPSMPQPMVVANPPKITPQVPPQPITNVPSATPIPVASSKKRKQPDTPSDDTSEEPFEDEKQRERRRKNALAARVSSRKKLQKTEMNQRMMTICKAEIDIVKSHAKIMIALLMARGVVNLIPPAPV